MNYIFRKKDLKNINNLNNLNIDSLNINNFIFENDEIKELYEIYKNKTILEIRIDMCIKEDYFYLDLSEMGLTDNNINEYFNNDDIKILLCKIEMLDISNNNLCNYIDLDLYSNIKYVNISFNKISDIVKSKYIVELNCENNNITEIISNSIVRLIAHDNLIENINLSNIEYLIIYNNKLKELSDFNNIITLDCRNNNIINIDYIKSLKTLCCTTNVISKNYNILNIDKINNNYYLDFI
jgi:hypothetical protein